MEMENFVSGGVSTDADSSSLEFKILSPVVLPGSSQGVVYGELWIKNGHSDYCLRSAVGYSPSWEYKDGLVSRIDAVYSMVDWKTRISINANYDEDDRRILECLLLDTEKKLENIEDFKPNRRYLPKLNFQLSGHGSSYKWEVTWYGWPHFQIMWTLQARVYLFKRFIVSGPPASFWKHLKVNPKTSWQTSLGTSCQS
jgi:hypothetical protein